MITKTKLIFKVLKENFTLLKLRIHKLASKIADFFKIPKWLRREIIIFLSMFWEAGKFILAALIAFGLVYGVLNGPAVYQNVRYWVFVNYKDEAEDVYSYWGIKLPEIGERSFVAPANTIIIPKIGVQAPIIWLSSNEESVILDALKSGVVHYAGTAKPGEIGNVFITGHSSYYWWSGGAYNHIFALLDKLVIGDQIIINFENVRYMYIVNDIDIVSPRDLSVLEPTPIPTLTLMTCTPLGTSFKRLIVKAKQINPPPKTQKALPFPALPQI